MSSRCRLRFSLSPEDANRILKKKKLRGKRLKTASVSRTSEIYFDTPGFSFAKSGVSLRIESGNGLRRQAMSQIARAPEWMRPVRTWVSTLEPCEPAFVSAPGVAGPAAFKQIFSVSRERHGLILKDGDAKIGLAIDRGQIEVDDGDGEPRLEELVEAELSSQSEEKVALYTAALDLLDSARIRLQPRSVAHRGFVLAGEKSGLKHVKAEKIALTPEMSVGEALQASCHNVMEHLLQNEAGALAGHPNGIHQTRVAMRRLRAALRAFKSALPYEGRKAFGGELRWFQQKTAPARDWHVFLDETVKHLSKETFDKGDLEALADAARENREEFSQEAADYLTSRRYTRLLLRLGHWVAELSEDKSPRLTQPIVPFARKAITKSHRDLLREIASVREGVLEDLHSVRIKAKKARYAMEFFRSLFDPSATKAYLAQVKEMQERLGEANDARVARSLMAEIPPGLLKPETFEAFHLWATGRIDECLKRAHPGLEALKAEPLRLESQPAEAVQADVD